MYSSLECKHKNIITSRCMAYISILQNEAISSGLKCKALKKKLITWLDKTNNLTWLISGS